MSDFVNPELKDGPASMAASYLGNGPGLQPPDPLPIPDLEKVQDLFLDGMATGVAAILGQLLGDQGIEGEDQRPIIDGAINNVMSSLLDNPEGVEKEIGRASCTERGLRSKDT